MSKNNIFEWFEELRIDQQTLLDALKKDPSRWVYNSLQEIN